MTAKPKHANKPGSRSNDTGSIGKKRRRHDCGTCPYLRRLHRDNDDDGERLSASTSSSAPSPSSAVLSALAFIATSQSSVSGSPLPIQTRPPVFLCPSIEHDFAVPSLPTISPTPPLQLNNRASISTPTSQVPSRRRLADKYIQGMDNQWRKTDEWTLFGSTCCTSTSNVTDAVTSPSQSSTYSAASVAPEEFDVAALPAGWQTSTSSGAEPTIILALSIILAVALFVFIVACAIWRRKKRKAAKQDLEAKLRHKLRPGDESEYGEQEMEREARGKMRVWAKATARWKANVRQSARRRRKKQSAMSRGARSHSPAPLEHHEPSVVNPSRCPSPTNAESQDDAPEQASVSPPDPDPQSPPEQSLPPAYRPSSATYLNASTSRRTSFLSDPGSPSATPHAEPAPYTPPTSGHVSIDDKRELERLGELASAPPEPEHNITGSSRTAVSVPTFDEALEDSDAYPELEPYSAPSFPSPPSKTTMLRGEDIPIVEPVDDGQFTASAPPPDDRFSLEPSAPSLEDEGDDYLYEHSHIIIDAHTSHSHPLVPSSASSSWRLSSSSAMNAIPPSYHP